MSEKFELEADIGGFGYWGEQGVYYIVLRGCKQINEIARPGQFVMIWPKPDSYEHLLGRPFSIYGAPPPPWEKYYPDALQIIFKKVGKGTELLATGGAGRKVRVLGPLGNGWSMDKDFKEALIVAGGIGVVSLMWLARELSQRGKEIRFFLGARNKNEFLCVDECRKKGFLYTATDDGTVLDSGPIMQIKGSVTDLLRSFEIDSLWQLEKPHIFASGPMEMLKGVAEIAKIHGTPAQVAVEGRMACGISACMGCAIKVKDDSDPDGWRYARICTDGPVFDPHEVIWK